MAKSVLKFTPQTDMAAKILFVVFFFYSALYTPVVQAIVSVAVGGIAFGYTESYEIAIVAALIMNFLFPILAALVRGGRKAEGFENGGSNSNVIANIQKIARKPIDGFGSQMSEGFEDAESNDLSLKADKKESKDTVATSAQEPGHIEPYDTDASGSKVAKKGKTEHFESQTPEQPGLFKLGAIPKDLKSGFHIDAGTTVMNALNSLKPDQMKAMTEDTKNLIETQKSLMSMLQTIKPMMSEGKQMMDTFQEMFGQQGMPTPA
jgi:hypothetical protein